RLLDVVPISAGARAELAELANRAGVRLRPVTGDISDTALLRALVDAPTRSIFHLSAIVSGTAEANFDLGWSVNLDGSRALLEACRHADARARVVFTSSVAVYGGALPDLVGDDTALNPQSSYGAQKAMAELLLSDYTRKGFVDGRVLRLPTISVRPGRPNGAASSFASGIIREPLAGETARCPVAPQVRLWLLSPERAIEALIHGHELPTQALGQRRAVNLPGLSISVAEMAQALSRVAGAEVAARIEWQPDEQVERIVATWPPAWDTTRALALGFTPDTDFDAVIRAHQREMAGPTSDGEQQLS
ncbi:MAG: SDR family oxidoreductase, partial [Betaproteobacteria bacterium]|nr:SDR family oxidoreductase [Betaproteobacteria bacterium]